MSSFNASIDLFDWKIVVSILKLQINSMIDPFITIHSFTHGNWKTNSQIYNPRVLLNTLISNPSYDGLLELTRFLLKVRLILPIDYRNTSVI